MAVGQRRVLHHAHIFLYFQYYHEYKIKYRLLPFCVRTGVPDDRVPATDKRLATVDILLKL
jgi:hypothetical protein